MGYYTDISSSSNSAKDTALQNRMNGVSNHNVWGLFLSQNAPSMAVGIGNSIYNWVKSSDSNDVYGPALDTTNIFDSKKSSANIATFTDAMKAFGTTPNKETAQALQNAYNADPKNPTIARFYKKYKTEVEKLV